MGKKAFGHLVLILGQNVEREPVRLSDGLGQVRVAPEGHQDQRRLERGLHSPRDRCGMKHVGSRRSQDVNTVRKKIQGFRAYIGRRCFGRHDNPPLSLATVMPNRITERERANARDLNVTVDD
jgi:hypothetical protein